MYGNCISMQKRCDGKYDCPRPKDNSDENNCSIIILPEDYSSKLHPSSEFNDRVDVNVTINLRNVFDIQELSMAFKVRVQITMEWFDPRITFHNLKESAMQNIVSLEESKRLWLPTLFFENAYEGWYLGFV